MASRQGKQQQQPLAIEATAYGQASGWRAGEDLLDALPYYDGLTEPLQQQAQLLIDEEMTKSSKQPSDYLKSLPPVPPPTFGGHEMLQKEYERVRAKQPMPRVDTQQRYSLAMPPQSKRGDPSAWRAAAENAAAGIEHQHLRILNLELMLKNGDKNWRAQVQLDEALEKSLAAELATAKQEIDAVNRERKLQQSAAGAELSKLEQEYRARVLKNFEIDNACGLLEEEVAALRAAVEAAKQQQQPQQQQQQQAVEEQQAAEEQQATPEQAQQEGTGNTGSGPDPMDTEANGVAEHAA